MSDALNSFSIWGRTIRTGTSLLSLTHNFSTRLSFYANVYAAYETEPNFKSNVGPENVRADHFNTIDIFARHLSMAPAI